MSELRKVYAASFFCERKES
ncbi:hypothetical protein BsWGS_16195 [Bradybaena similaris]